MDYKILDKSNIQEYMYSIDEIKNYFQNDELIIDEIGDGNLNYVFIIKSKNNESKALILKQAVPYLRCVGEEYPLSRERMTYEIRALKTFYNETTEFIPKLYDTNEEMSTVVMQFLSDHIIMRNGMINQVIYPSFSEHISTYLARNLFKTSSLYLNSTDKRKLIDNFNSNTELCKLTEDFVFTFAFMENETNDTYSQGHKEFEKLLLDEEFKKEVLGLKYKFMTKNDALLHGDLHTGSIMLNEKETYVIDPEFSFVGPFGFDIGALIGNLTMSYTSHIALKSDESYTQWILETIAEVLEKFETKFLQLWNETNESSLITNGFISDRSLDEYKQEFMKEIMSDTAGFAGCKMSRRMFGIAGVADIRDIEDENVRDNAIALTLSISKRFVKECIVIKTKEEIINIIKEETK